MNIFLTGASSGIGEALAKELAAKGASLGLVARRKEKLDALIASLPRPHIHTAIVCDVTNRDELIKKAREFDEKCGGVDIAIACAGVSIGVKTQYREDLDVFDQVFETNVLSVASTFHAFIDPMLKRKRGTLVGIASVAGIRGLPGSEAYCASKSAVITYCESLRVEMKKHGIDVVTISPGFVKTPLTAKNPYKMPFLLTPEEFAKEAVKAIEHKKSYVTIPWQMGVLSKILRIIPNALFDKILASRKQKPRKTTSPATQENTEKSGDTGSNASS